MSAAAAVTANVLVLAWIVYAAALQLFSPDFYYMSVQEDEYLEWATFWAFIGAAVFQIGLARRQYKAGTTIPWFAFGLALFCIFVAMEEISWGQRLLAYQPPEYFLRENFQQEPNIHNVFDTSLRKLALQVVIGGYGIVLPVLARLGGSGPLLTKLGVTAPPLSLIPAFAGTLLLYIIYPWSFSGEIVELMLGTGFLVAAETAKPRSAPVLVGMCTAVLILGTATSMSARVRKSSDEAYLKLARTEVEALAGDFLDGARPELGNYITRCNLHKRVYTYVEKYRQHFLAHGRFSELKAQGLSEDRAAYFLDPWNAPYWIRDKCNDETGQRSIFVYSFGPNHRRDSNDFELRADDVGMYILTPAR
jgi:hypothetical protein